MATLHTGSDERDPGAGRLIRRFVPPSARRETLLVALVVAVVLLPLVVSLLSLIGAHWHASSDNALEVLRIRDVGGRHTPLTGVASRFGWDHPGPLLFWLLAPFRWAAGDTGILAGAGVLNGAALVAVLLLARRRGGLVLLAIVATALLLLYRALGTDLLVDPWNPWVTVLPFFVYVLLAWSLAERDFVTLPALVAVGSFIVQTHVGYAPLVAGIGAVGAVLAVFARPAAGRAPETGGPDLRRVLVIAAIVGGVLWLAPVAQQVAGHPGNLGRIVDSFRHPPEPTQGFANGAGIMGNELRGAWLTGHDGGPLGAAAVGTAGTLPALALLAGACALGFASWRRKKAGAARLVAAMVTAAGIGVLAGARIIGFPADYLVRWWWVLGALLWCAVVWSGVSLLGSRADRFVVPIAIVAMVAVSAVLVRDAAGVRVPGARFSAVVGTLAPPTAARLSQRFPYRFAWVDSTALGAVGYGLYLDLVERGFDVKVPPAYLHSFGGRHTLAPGADVQTVTVVTGDDLDGGWVPPTGATRLAQFDPLDAADRARAGALARRIRAELGPGSSLHPNAVDASYGRAQLARAGVDTATVDALRRLRAAGIPYVVFLVPAST